MSESVTLACGHVMNFTGTPITAPGSSQWQYKGSPDAAIQVLLTGTGAVTATVIIDVSNDGVNACATPAATITLSGASPQSDGFATQNASWKFVRLRVTAITGTGAAVTGTIGN